LEQQHNHLIHYWYNKSLRNYGASLIQSNRYQTALPVKPFNYGAQAIQQALQNTMFFANTMMENTP
jgi:hypothetical protein